MKIKSISRREYNGKVYNIGTAPNHNYFANGMLVHNCYQGSTPEGSHATMSEIDTILYTLAKEEVFEIAYGGGEPTQHPLFIDILKKTRDYNIVPNFTTRDLKWLQQNINDIADVIGSCAVSVTCTSEIKKIQTIRDFYGLKQHKMCAQLVMGTVAMDTFERIVQDACEANIPLTLLGYKMTGRGPQYNKYDYSNWMEVVKRVVTRSPWHKIGVDTALVQQSPEDMLTAPNWLYHADEGQFSWYIDAVAKSHGPSSYDTTEKYTSSFEIMKKYAEYGV